MLTLEAIGLVTTVQAVQEVPKIHAHNVRDWARRGLIKPVQRDRRGRPIYRLTDIYDAEMQTRDNRGRRRPA